MKNRNREFNDVRNKNLAQSSIYIPANSAYNASSHQHNPNNNQSFTSSFAKKSKPDVCVTCVNKKIAVQKKNKDYTDKAKQIQQFKAQIEYRNAQRDLAKEKREKMLRQASDYNRSLIGKNQKETQSQKLLDSRYISELLEKDNKAIQEEKEYLQKQKEAHLNYRKELYLQKIKQEERKQQEKEEKKKPEINQLNLKYFDKTKMIKEYSTELKKQINTNKMKIMTEKQKKVEEEKKLLQQSQSEFLKYTEFLNPQKQSHSFNPEVFQDLKLIDYTKKIRRIEQIQTKNKERQEQLRRQRDLLKSETERSLRSKRDYERQLKQQMTQRYLKTAAERQEDLKFTWKVQKYTEDILAESKIIKPCQECQHSYEQKYTL